MTVSPLAPLLSISCSLLMVWLYPGSDRYTVFPSSKKGKVTAFPQLAFTFILLQVDPSKGGDNCHPGLLHGSSPGILAAFPGIQGYWLFFQVFRDTGCSSRYAGILAALPGIQGYWLLFQVYRDTGCSFRNTGLLLAALPSIQGYWLYSSRNTGILAALPGIQGFWLLFQEHRDTSYSFSNTGILAALTGI